ncbi:uncharacterized protein ISCGN_012820 [Ixodes scapularis]
MRVEWFRHVPEDGGATWLLLIAVVVGVVDATDDCHRCSVIRETIKGFHFLPESIKKADRLGILETLQSSSVLYVVAIIASFSLLLLLYSGSFIMGMFYYDEGVPPTKRSWSSNYSGLAMLLAIVLSFPICGLLMTATLAIMLVALTLTNYVCRPFENIVYGSLDIVQVSLLDDTMSVIWPREMRGKWFGQFLAGTTLTICNGGRLFDILKGDYMDAVYYIIQSTDVPANKPATYFDSMKRDIWNQVDKMNEYFINDMLTELQAMHDRHFHIVNPPCFAAYKGYERSLAFLCKGIIRNANAFWSSLKFCLWLFLALGVVSHLLSKYFLRMVNYTYDGSEVESFTA